MPLYNYEDIMVSFKTRAYVEYLNEFVEPKNQERRRVLNSVSGQIESHHPIVQGPKKDESELGFNTDIGLMIVPNSCLSILSI